MIFSQIRKKYPWLFEYTITILVFLCAFTLPLSATLKSIFFPWLVIELTLDLFKNVLSS